MQNKKIYFVANARMPSEKAHGIHIAKMCEAFIEAGRDVTLVVPSRATGSIQDFYALRVEVPIVRVPSIVFGAYERAGFAIMGLSFALSSLGFLWGKKLAGEKFLIYTVDIDSFSHTLLPLAGATVGELHAPKRSTFLARFFFKRAAVVTTNPLIAEELRKTFGTKAVVEPNGVDEAFFNLPKQGGGGALYVGRLYKWKGLEILSAVQKISTVPITILGGTREEYERLFGQAGTLRFADAKPDEVPARLAAADVLLLTGTLKNQESNRYTAPMKVFEYLATGKPVVASGTEALKSLIPASLVRYCPPDDPQALAAAIMEALKDPGDSAARIALAREHTWRKRAERIAAHCLHD